MSLLSQPMRFAGFPESTMQWHPMRTPAPFTNRGVILGLNMMTGRIVMVDLWLMKKMGLINAPLVLFTGLRGHAKSSLEKCFLGRSMAIPAGHTTEGGVIVPRGQFNSRKRLKGGHAEEEEYVRWLGGDVVDLSQYSLNFVDPKAEMRLSDLLYVVLTNAQFANHHQPLDHFVLDAFQVATAEMMAKNPRTASPLVLREYLDKLTPEKFTKFFADEFTGFRNEIAAQADGVVLGPDGEKEVDEDLRDEMAKLVALSEGASNAPADERMKGAARAAVLMNHVIRLLGSTGGTKTSLWDVLRGDMVLLDWSEVPEETRSLLEININLMKNAAVNRGYYGIIPHIVAWDEEQEGYDNADHVAALFRWYAKARSIPSTDIRLTQYELAIRYAGAEGSDMRRRALAINDGVELRGVGLQPDSIEYRAHLIHLGFSPRQAHFLTTSIPKGCWAFKVKNRPALLVQAIRTKSEIPFTETDQIEDEMTADSGELVVDPMYLQYLANNGQVEWLGGEDVADAAHDLNRTLVRI